MGPATIECLGGRGRYKQFPAGLEGFSMIILHMSDICVSGTRHVAPSIGRFSVPQDPQVGRGMCQKNASYVSYNDTAPAMAIVRSRVSRVSQGTAGDNCFSSRLFSAACPAGAGMSLFFLTPFHRVSEGVKRIPALYWPGSSCCARSRVVDGGKRLGIGNPSL